jgi:hypothetical protein
MDNLNFDNVNVEYDFTFKIYLQFLKNYNRDNPNNPLNCAFHPK